MPIQFKNPHQGTILIITLFFIVLLTFEVAMISFVMQRSVGEKAIGNTAYQAARNGTQVATQRLKDDLYAYIVANGTTNVLTDFAKGGANDIDNENLMAYDAVAGINKDTGVDISAWVESDSRGIWYHIVSRGKFQESDILTHEWVKLNDFCMSTTTGSALTTIGQFNMPGQNSVPNNMDVIQSDGRVFFGDETSPGNYYTWHANTGLSTIVSSYSGGALGHKSANVGPDGRLYFNSDDGNRAFTWTEGTGLSTLLTGSGVFAQSASAADSSGRFYFGGGTRFYTWKQSTGLSTLITVGAGSLGARNTLAIDMTNNRIFVGNFNQPGAWSWKESTGLSTITLGAGANGYAIKATRDQRVYMAYYDVIQTWHPSTGLSTVAKVSGVGLGRNGAMSPVDEGYVDTVNPISRIYFGAGWDTGAPFWTWAPGAGLTTIYSVAPGGGTSAPEGVVIDPNSDRVMISNFHWSGPTPLLTYHASTGLSTLASGMGIGHESLAVNSDGRWFIGGHDDGGGPSPFLTWTAASGLSTIGTGFLRPGIYSTVTADDGRVYFGSGYHAAPQAGGLYTWHPTSGLSTIVTGEMSPGVSWDGGYKGLSVSNDGTVFFGEKANPGTMWAYKAGGTSGGCEY